MAWLDPPLKPPLPPPLRAWAVAVAVAEDCSVGRQLRMELELAEAAACAKALPCPLDCARAYAPAQIQVTGYCQGFDQHFIPCIHRQRQLQPGVMATQVCRLVWLPGRMHASSHAHAG